jgi:chemotaxis protein CheD
MNASSQIIEVGIADLKIASSPSVLVTRGLGSCLGIVVYEPFKKIGALAHPMLSCQEHCKIKNNPAKFVDSSIKVIIDEFKQRDCSTVNLGVKIFGGAHVFTCLASDSVFNIGARNIEAAREIFASYKIKILAEDVGGNYGRTITFDLETGKVCVKTMFYGEREV